MGRLICGEETIGKVKAFVRRWLWKVRCVWRWGRYKVSCEERSQICQLCKVKSELSTSGKGAVVWGREYEEPGVLEKDEEDDESAVRRGCRAVSCIRWRSESSSCAQTCCSFRQHVVTLLGCCKLTLIGPLNTWRPTCVTRGGDGEREAEESV